MVVEKEKNPPTHYRICEGKTVRDEYEDDEKVHKVSLYMQDAIERQLNIHPTHAPQSLFLCLQFSAMNISKCRHIYTYILYANSIEYFFAR